MKIGRSLRNQKRKAAGIMHQIQYRLSSLFNSRVHDHKLHLYLFGRILLSTILISVLFSPPTVGSAKPLTQASKSANEVLSQLSDSDMDGLPDTTESTLGTNPFDPDTDGDVVLDGEEVNLYSTHPLNRDSDGDASGDGIEIEIETDPLNNGSRPAYSKTISFSSVTQEAFNLKQIAYNDPYLDIQDIPVLDPPPLSDPSLENIGLVFDESNAIGPPPNSNLIDQLQWYALARPRAALDKLRFRVYIDNNNDGTYDLRTYVNANLQYPSPPIQPRINTELLPIAGKVLSRFIIGHAQSGQGSPQFFDFNANGYGRFNGFFPQSVGASYRIATHNVFRRPGEDFPSFTEIYFRILDTNTSNLIGLVDSAGFTGAMNFKLTPGEESTMTVSARFFPRKNILISQEPHTGLAGYSSMFWKNEDDTLTVSTDEAHDSDILVVGYDIDRNGVIDKIVEHEINNPPCNSPCDPLTNPPTVTDFSMLQTGKQIYFALENRDRNASHYSTHPAAYETRSSYSIQLISSNIPLSMMLYEDHTDVEYNDNIVINLAVKQNLMEAHSIADAVTIEYITKAYFPDDSDDDGLTDQLERLVGTDINNPDSDGEGGNDYLELLAGNDPLKPSIPVNVQVQIAGSNVANHNIPLGSILRASYTGIDNGPIKIQSNNNVPLVASERVAYSPNGGTTWTSYSEMMGLPANQLTNSYTFPWYNNVDLNSQLRFANVGNINTTVTVAVGGIVQGNYPLTPNQSQRVSYPGLDKGPVKVTSSGNVPIIASLRVAYFNGSKWASFSEMMGLPSNKLTNSYIFPWYNNLDLNSQLRFGNVGTAPTTVTVTVGGIFQGSYQLAPNESKRVSYPGLDKGPVKVTSSGNVPIIASMRVAYHNGSAWTDFSEMMGLPVGSLSTRYSFPVYNNVNLNTQLRFANVGNATTTVTVTIGGVLKGTYALAPNESKRLSYAGLDSGPVVVQSSGGIPIVASERVAYFNGSAWTSYAEMMGLPQSQLSTTFLFPWYNNLDLDTQLRFGVP